MIRQVLTVPTLAAVLLLAAGCGASPDSPNETQAELYRPDPATAATLRGVVRFEGKPPAPVRISMVAEQGCQNLNPDGVLLQTVVAGPGGGLRDAFVYIQSGLEGKAFEAPEQAVVLDQRGCMFVPRVVPLRAGQTLQVRNSDPVSHSVRPLPENNREWNQHMDPGSLPFERRFPRPEVMIPVKCNLHAWMRSYLAVLDHPYFAVTGESGAFEWTGLPPGDYTIAVWHETLGELTARASVGEQAEETVELTYRLGPAQ